MIFVDLPDDDTIFRLDDLTFIQALLEKEKSRHQGYQTRIGLRHNFDLLCATPYEKVRENVSLAVQRAAARGRRP